MKSCCLCFIKIELNPLENVAFPTIDDGIFAKIQMHLNINIKDIINDQSSVCTLCIKKIDQFHEFYQHVHENQEKFSKSLYKVKMGQQHLKKEESVDFKIVNLVAIEHSKCTIDEKHISDETVNENCIKKRTRKITVSQKSKLNYKTSEIKQRKCKNTRQKTNSIDRLQPKSTTKDTKLESNDVHKELKKDDDDDVNSNEKEIENNENDLSDDNYEDDDNNESDFDIKFDELNDEARIEVKGENLIQEPEEFPKVVIKDGKLQIQGNALLRLMQRFFVLTCDICLKNSITNKSSDNNLSSHSSIKSLISHYKDVHNIKGYISCCDKKLSSRRLMVWHFAYHINPDEFTCQQCGAVMSRPSALTEHIQKKHDPNYRRRGYLCSFCPRIYKNSWSLKLHLIEGHPSEDQKQSKFKCEECEKSFFSSLRLKEHIKNVHMEKTHICDVCGKKFRLKGNLKYHQSTHANDQSVQCEICKKWLKNEILVRRHLKRVHPATDELKCSECDYVTFIKTNLKLHIQRKHTNEKPHSCPYCDHKFKSRTNLNDHITQHTGVMTQCEYCPKEFITKSNYYTHRRRVHFEQLQKLNQQKEQQLIASKSKTLNS